MKKIISLLTVLCLFVVVMAGCSITQKLGLGSKDEVQPASSTVMTEEEASKLAGKVPVKLYFAEKDGTKLVAEIRHIPKEEIKVNVQSAVVKELLKGPTSSNAMKAAIPEGTQLLNAINVEKGVATVDLSKDFVDKMSKDKNAQNIAVFSIVNSLTEIKEIEKVKFTIDGKPVKEIGQFRFDTPFERSTSMIGKAVPTSSIAGEPAAETQAKPAAQQPAAQTQAKPAAQQPAAQTQTKQQ